MNCLMRFRSSQYREDFALTGRGSKIVAAVNASQTKGQICGLPMRAKVNQNAQHSVASRNVGVWVRTSGEARKVRRFARHTSKYALWSSRVRMSSSIVVRQHLQREGRRVELPKMKT